MNLQDLSRLDIKDLQKIDYKQVLTGLQKRPDIAVSIAVVILTIFVIIHTITQHQQEIQKLQIETQNLSDKSKAIALHDTTKIELEEYFNNIPPQVNEDDMINVLADFAKKHNIEIISLSPSQTNKKDLYDTTNISLDITAPDYKSIWQFIHAIEQSPYAFRVESWAGSMGPGTSGRSSSNAGEDQDRGTAMNVKLRISAINITKK